MIEIVNPKTLTVTPGYAAQGRINGGLILLCIIFAQGDSCRTCTFNSGTFDFANNLYFIEVKITRGATNQTPSATAFRLY